MDKRFERVPTEDLYDVKDAKPSDDPDELCGMGRFRPKWLQRFADPKVYLVIFCIIGVIEGAYFTYFVGVLSTLEKRFAFESKISGVILIADNISGAFISLLVGYYGGKGHKPRMIAFGMIIVSISAFLSAVPYFMYGPALHLLSRNESTFGTSKEGEYCSAEHKEENCENPESVTMLPAIIILFVANFLNGFGYTAYYTVGTAYLDDNVRKKNSPMYFSAMSALRIFGPVLGFLLSSVCLKYYEDPFYDPGVDPHNPRWVGAWWLGFIILGAILLFFNFLLALFPRQLPERFRSEKETEQEKKKETKKLPKLKDFPQEMKRLIKNPIFTCHMVSVTFQVNGFLGYFVFMPKFMEAQYLQSASEASLFSGTTGILSMLLGILLGGFIIKKYKPRPRYLTGYMVFVEMLSVLGLLVSMFLGCPMLQFPGTNEKEDETLNLLNECNFGCGCTTRIFEPVCGEDGVSTFFSPCFAGCPNVTEAASNIATVATTLASTIATNVSDALSITNKTVYEECRCTSNFNNTFTTSSVTNGYCQSDCNMFIIYIILLCISKFISSTARVGNTLIMFRCVDAKDKSFALGTFGSVLSAFAFIPYALIYGALTDSSCLVWEEKCGKTGNCWLYDSDKFRFYLHGMSMLLISIGICFDILVFLLSGRMKNFYGEDDEKAAQDDRIARWLKEEEEEDTVFTMCSKKDPTLSPNTVQ